MTTMTRWSGHNMIDPTELEARFAEEDSIAYLGSILTEPSEESVAMIEKVRSIMDGLPPREADFVDLYFFKQLKQTDIAHIFGVSQPTVCYRLQRATARIRFLLDLPDVTVDDIRHELGGFLSNSLDVEIMVLMFETTCQSEVASRLGVSQGLVRHRFIRSIKAMKKNSNLQVYADLFDTISKNLNILREIPRPDTEPEVLHAFR